MSVIDFFYVTICPLMGAMQQDSQLVRNEKELAMF
jgi:hypothetical protein